MFLGCKTLTISKANKQLFKPGIPNAKEYLNYSFIVSSKSNFKVDNISIENFPKELKYFYKNQNTGETSYKMLKPFIKGNYEFKFKLLNVDNISKNENLVFEYTINQKKKKQIIAIKTKIETVYLK